MGIILDLHLHTRRYSPCSSLSPEAAVKRAAKMNLDGIVFTEHNVLWEEGEVAELLEKTGQENLKVLVGRELRGCREDGAIHGDILVFGFNQEIEELYPTGELIGLIHDEGGVALAAHPFRSDLGFGDDVYNLDLDGIEVLTPRHYMLDTRKAEKARKSMAIAGVGGSDAHRKGVVGKYLTYFENAIENEEDLINEIKAGRCKPVSYRDAMNSRIKDE